MGAIEDHPKHQGQSSGGLCLSYHHSCTLSHRPHLQAHGPGVASECHQGGEPHFSSYLSEPHFLPDASGILWLPRITCSIICMELFRSTSSCCVACMARAIRQIWGI